jgi:hypothetical protein
MATKFQYAHGMSLSQAKHWFVFYFDMFFDKAKSNAEKFRYDIYVYEKVVKDGVEHNIHDYIDIEDFKRYWTPGFHLILVQITQS